MAARAEDLLPVEYFHVVFTLPAEIARIAYWNKKAVYDLLFEASAETVMTIAADPRRLGARVGMTSVLHTWGSALTHHPHVHMIVPGGGLSPDGARWVPCRPGFFLHVRVLSRLFRRLFLQGLLALHRAGVLVFFGDLAGFADAGAFAAWLAPFRKSEWVVYSPNGWSMPSSPFGGPEAVLAYLSRYTHRVAISNSRLVMLTPRRWPSAGRTTASSPATGKKVMRLATDEFIRRFLIHVLPDGFHRIRHYGLLASAAQRKANIAKIRAWLGADRPAPAARGARQDHPAHSARAMPLLWRPDAHHRDLPPRSATADAGAPKGAGGITIRPPHWPIRPRFPVRRRSPRCLPGRGQPRDCGPNRPLGPKKIPDIGETRQPPRPASRTMRPSPTTEAPTASALSP